VVSRRRLLERVPSLQASGGRERCRGRLPLEAPRRAPAATALIDWRAPFLALAALFAFRHQRHTVLFAVAAAPLLIVAAEQVRRALLERFPGLAPRPAVLATALAGVAAVALLQLHGYAAMLASQGLTIRYGRLDFPADAVEFLRANGITGNIAMPFEWDRTPSGSSPPRRACSSMAASRPSTRSR
jgi:hypothetical protein